MLISKTYEREVVKIREVTGPKGGKYLVLDLSCSHWLTSRTPKQKARCIACHTLKQLGIQTDAAARLDAKQKEKAVEEDAESLRDQLEIAQQGLRDANAELARRNQALEQIQITARGLNHKLGILNNDVAALKRHRDLLLVAVRELGRRPHSQTCTRQMAHAEVERREVHCQCDADEHNRKVNAVLKECGGAS